MRARGHIATAGRLTLSPAALLRRARGDSLTRNSFYIMATTVVTSALGYVFWILVARSTPTAEVGLAAALISVTTFASMLSTLGAGTTLVLVLPTRESGLGWSRTFDACMSIGFAASVLAGCILVAVLPLASAKFSIVRDFQLAAAVIIGLVFWTTTTVLDYAFIAERRAGRLLVRNSAAAILKLAVVGAFIAVGEATSLGVVRAWMISTGVSLAFGLFVLLPGLQRGYRPQLRGMVAEVRNLVTPFVGNYFVSLGGSSRCMSCRCS